MTLLFRGAVAISSIVTDEGNAVESADVSMPLTISGADAHWQASREVAPGQADTLALDSLPVVVFDEGGLTSLSEVHLLYVRNRSGDAIRVTGPESLAGGGVIVRAWGVLLVASPGFYEVATGDDIVIESIENDPSTVTYDILLVGVKEQA